MTDEPFSPPFDPRGLLLGIAPGLLILALVVLAIVTRG